MLTALLSPLTTSFDLSTPGTLHTEAYQIHISTDFGADSSSHFLLEHRHTDTHTEKLIALLMPRLATVGMDNYGKLASAFVRELP